MEEKKHTIREITEHRINLCNQGLFVVAAGEPGPGGAHHRYTLECPERTCYLLFQDGAVNEVGTNGVTHEALIAIILDRLRAFQSGPYACRENALVITKLEEAMHWLHHRTRLREARGVEGTMEV